MTVALLSRPSDRPRLYALFPFTKPSLSLRLEAQPTFSCRDVSQTRPSGSSMQDIQQPVLWFRSQLPVRVESISLIFVIFWVLLCLSSSVQVKAEISISKWLLRVFLQGHEDSVVSICRRLNKSNEFPGEVGGSQNQAALLQYVPPLPL